MNPEVSIIVPIYNMERYLKRCVDSILAQTFTDIEMILVDDGSADSSLQICDEYKNHDSRIKVVHKNNEGLPMARRTGVMESKGKFLCFVDADDWIEPNMIETLLSAIKNDNADSVVCRYIKDYPSGKSIPSAPFDKKKICGKKEAIEAINYNKMEGVSVCNKILKKEYITADFFKENATIGEDYYFSMKYLLNTNKTVFIPNILYHYVQHQESMSYAGYKGNGKDILQSYTEIKDLIIKECPEVRQSAIAYWALQEMAVVISMIKSDKYDNEIIKKVQIDLKKTYGEYHKIKEVPLYLKICCLIIILRPYLMIFLYKYLFKWRYKVEG